MTLNVRQRPAPSELSASTLVLRRQQRSHNQADYDAVMDSKELLRIWSDSTLKMRSSKRRMPRISPDTSAISRQILAMVTASFQLANTVFWARSI